MFDDCPNCGSPDVDYFNNGEAHCVECGYVFSYEEDEE